MISSARMAGGSYYSEALGWEIMVCMQRPWHWTMITCSRTFLFAYGLQTREAQSLVHGVWRSSAQVRSMRMANRRPPTDTFGIIVGVGSLGSLQRYVCARRLRDPLRPLWVL